ncbi:WG repeat-containing protein [Fulvivirgaceae bacterium BMA10]|uniref:WG repeat-containing protein n=2 Tax=Splendidivirga corallicola TaxID=3051826 RepID=A0ABT8KWP9_9BACT|nr:WG repeat-containing protein [Fulvivirgaceae bacterium BMA10]
MAKSLEKDSINPGARYIFSLLYLTDTFSKYNLDTSYLYIQGAINDYKNIDLKEIERLNKIGISDSTLISQKNKIDEIAFKLALSANNVSGFNDFLSKFPTAIQVGQATRFRDQIAFAEALELNTYQAFKKFMETYPKAVQFEEASKRYNALVFASKTKDKSLKSYEQFLRDFPNTPFRKETEKQIFEISTASNKPGDYYNFIKRYPESEYAQQGANFLFYSLDGRDKFQALGAYNDVPLYDSLLQAAILEKTFLFPIYEKGKYGFIDPSGKVVLEANTFDFIDEEYKCSGIHQDYLVMGKNGKKELVSKDFKSFFDRDFDEVEDLGFGLLKLKSATKFGVLHKSGIQILDPVYEDVQLFHNTFIAFLSNGKWGIKTLAGRTLFEATFDEILLEGNFIIFEKDDRFAISNRNQLLDFVNEDNHDLNFNIEDYELIDRNTLQIFQGEKEGIVNSALNIQIELDEQSIVDIRDGWLLKKDGKYTLLKQNFEASTPIEFDDAIAEDRWLALKKGEKWSLFGANGSIFSDFMLDSISILGQNIALLFEGEKAFAYFSNDQKIDISNYERVRILTPLPDYKKDLKKEVEFFEVSTNGKDKLFKSDGTQIYEGRSVEFSPLNDKWLIVERRGKKGLIDIAGNTILKSIYDIITPNDQHHLSIWRDKKFGLMAPDEKIYIAPEYDAKLERYNHDLLIASKRGRKGLITTKKKSMTSFDFEEIQFWSDSVALVKKDGSYGLYAFYTDEMIQSDIDHLQWIQNDTKEKIAIINKEAQFGVISNLRSEVIAPTFNDIVLIGDKNNSLFFCEKHVAEADFYVVIYYDINGETIRKQVFQADEYDKIYCNQ